MSIADKLQTLIDVKEDIKSAIEEKGISVTGDLTSYADVIDQIEGGEIFYVPDGMKFGRSSFTSFPQSWDTSNVIDMSWFFAYSDGNIKDVSSINTSNVTDMSYMFGDCSSLTSLDLNHFDTSKVTDMSYMFSGCSSLTSLDISSFDFSNVKNVDHFLAPSGLNTTHKNLTNLKFGKNLKVDWTYDNNGTYDWHPYLTKESVLSIIDGLYDFVGNGETTTRKCQLGSNLSKLTDNEIATAINKGWTLYG